MASPLPSSSPAQPSAPIPTAPPASPPTDQTAVATEAELKFLKTIDHTLEGVTRFIRSLFSTLSAILWRPSFVVHQLSVPPANRSLLSPQVLVVILIVVFGYYLDTNNRGGRSLADFESALSTTIHRYKSFSLIDAMLFAVPVAGMALLLATAASCVVCWKQTALRSTVHSLILYAICFTILIVTLLAAVSSFLPWSIHLFTFVNRYLGPLVGPPLFWIVIVVTYPAFVLGWQLRRIFTSTSVAKSIANGFVGWIALSGVMVTTMFVNYNIDKLRTNARGEVIDVTYPDGKGDNTIKVEVLLTNNGSESWYLLKKDEATFESLHLPPPTPDSPFPKLTYSEAAPCSMNWEGSSKIVIVEPGKSSVVSFLIPPGEHPIGELVLSLPVHTEHLPIATRKRIGPLYLLPIIPAP